MADHREIRVKATAPASAVDDAETIHQLSELDLVMPKLYIHMIEIFELEDSANKDKIVDNLTKGLARTLADYPILTGTLHFDNDTRRIVVKTKPDSTVALHVVKESPSSDIPSFAVLDQHDFPVHVLDSPKVLPPLFVGQNGSPVPAADISSEGPAAAGAQITFIKGGVILGLAIPHQVTDAMGFEILFATWARYTAAAASNNAHELNGVPARTGATDSSRKLLSAATKPNLSAEELKQLVDKYPVMKLRDGPPAPPPAGFKMPTVKTRVWHFPRSKLDKRKAQCSVGLPAGGDSWVSTYDALLAIMWRATVRAKSPLVKPAPDAPSRAIHAVNARGRTAQPVPKDYIGAAVTMPLSETLTVTEVLGADLDATLPKLARAVRASINSVNPEYVSGLIRYAAGSADLRWSELDMHWVLGLDCMAFDWHTMKSYREHDFGSPSPSGLGTPAAVRWPHPGFEGFFFVLPSRAGVRGAGADEGLEVCFGLEESCFARLEEDVEFAQYAEQRGVGI